MLRFFCGRGRVDTYFLCAAGWQGFDCAAPVCPNGGSSHGICQPSGRCRCANGWQGADCATPLCPLNCSGAERGACVAVGPYTTRRN